MSNAVPNGDLFGHPKGLFLLFTAEMWKRFSDYAMRVILVLYSTEPAIGMATCLPAGAAPCDKGKSE